MRRPCVARFPHPASSLFKRAPQKGQIHGGLTQGLAPALFEEITSDEDGNNLSDSFMDYLVPTAMETPAWETGRTCTPSPHHPIGAKGVGESATVGAPPAIVNAVVDALCRGRYRPALAGGILPPERGDGHQPAGYRLGSRSKDPTAGLRSTLPGAGSRATSR